MDERASCFRQTKDGLEIFVRLTPRSSKDAVEGTEQGSDGRSYLKARVRAVPEDGKANWALEKLMAKGLGVAQRDVSVVSGTTSRLKTVLVTGKAQDLVAGLNAILGESARGGGSEEGDVP